MRYIIFALIFLPLPNLARADETTIGIINADDIEKVIDINLDAKPVILSKQAEKHIIEKHPEDFDLCMSHLKNGIENPDYAGVNPNHPNNFQIIERTLDNKHLLIAVSQKPDSKGRYRIRTCYQLREEKAQNIISKQYVKPIAIR